MQIFKATRSAKPKKSDKTLPYLDKNSYVWLEFRNHLP